MLTFYLKENHTTEAAE